MPSINSRPPSEQALSLRSLKETLASATMRTQQPRHPSTYENDFAASSLLMKMLRSAIPLRPLLYHADAVRVLDDARSQVSVDHLEQRGWVQFPLGWLHLPRAVRMELLRRRRAADGDGNGQVMTEEEVAVLRILQDTMPDSGDWNWISAAELNAIRESHFAAHPLTPSISSLCEQGLLSFWTHQNTEGYRIRLHGHRSGEQWEPVIGHALALLWKELLRGDSFTDDSARLRHWLTVGSGAYAILDAPAFLESLEKERLLTSCNALLLASDQEATRAQEADRIRFEIGLAVRDDHALQPPPDDADDLLAQYEWWNGTGVNAGGISMWVKSTTWVLLVAMYDDAPGARRMVQLVEGSTKHPYILAATTSHRTPGLIAGLLRNPRTVSLGMKVLSRVTVVDDHGSLSGSYATGRDQQERTRTELWQQGVQVFVDTCWPGLQAQDRATVEQICDVLSFTVRAATFAANSAQGTSERACAEARLSILLAALEQFSDEMLEPVFARLPSYLDECAEMRRRERDDFERMPLSELRLAFWWLRVAARGSSGTNAGSIQAAETILRLYCTELNRGTTSRAKAVYWLNDVPQAAQLPWHELALVLQPENRMADLLQPAGVSFQQFPDGADLSTELSDKERLDEIGLLARAWMHKVRLHTRVLNRVYALARAGLTEAPPEAGDVARQDVLTQVECSLVELVGTFAVGDAATGRPSMFEADLSYPQPGNEALPILAKALVEVFNLFPEPRRLDAFAAWLQVETEPLNLLVILAEALPAQAKQGATTKLENVSIQALLNRQFWLPMLQRLAEQANAAGQVNMLERILAFGDARLQNHASHSEWELFAYRMRLSRTSREGRREMVEELPEPSNPEQYQTNVNGRLRDPVAESKLFYSGLAVLQSDPREAQHLFATLRERNPGVTVYTVNWFAASLAAAQRVEDWENRRSAFRIALQEWRTAKATIPVAEAEDTTVRLNELIAFESAEFDPEFDALWEKLGSDLRAHLEFVTLALANATRRGLHNRIRLVIDHARPFFMTAEGNLSAEFIALEREAGSSFSSQAVLPVTFNRMQNIIGLRSAHLQIRVALPEDVAAIVGHGGRALHEFIFDQFGEAAKEFLNHQTVWRHFLNEDDHNDFFVVLLRMRFALLGWQILDQSHGGTGRSGGRAGERDWTLKDSNSSDLAVFEALVLRSVDTAYVNEHVDKLVGRYNPLGLRNLFVIVYHEGSDFPDFWDRYLTHVKTMDVAGRLRLVRAAPLDLRVANIRSARLTYDQDGTPLHLYHLAMSVPKPARTTRG